MPEAQLNAGAALCKKLMQDHSLTERDIKLHKDLSATVCPGKNFRISELKELLLTTVQNPPPTESIIYIVQVGAFLVKSNAELLMHNLIKQGYSDVFIRDNC